MGTAAIQEPESRLPSWSSPAVDEVEESTASLALRYRAYRGRQAASLLRLMPREAVRAFYARAREWAMESGQHDPRDPMDSLLRFAESILPLPPFEVWKADRARYPLGHLDDTAEATPEQRPGRPAPLEQRRFHAGGGSWTATLFAFRDGLAWRGFIAFQSGSDPQRYQTANIFRESTPQAVQDRFRTFDRDTLAAFLASVLP